ncbi:MAG: OmpA family protein [Desulfobulbaceae bacterium]|nr:OmpA family protein [Desulfobulbaceae bacterium]
MKSRIALWTAIAIVIYTGATLYHNNMVKKYQKISMATSTGESSPLEANPEGTIAPDQGQMLRLQEAKSRARQLLATQKEKEKSMSQPVEAGTPIGLSAPSKVSSTGEEQKIAALQQNPRNSQNSLQQSSNTSARITILEQRIAKANELIAAQRKELSKVGTERKDLLRQTGDKDINLSVFDNKIKDIEQKLEQKNNELRKNLSELAAAEKKLEQARLVEKKAKGLELLIDSLKVDLDETRAKLTTANSRILSLSTSEIQKSEQLERAGVDLGIARDKLDKLEKAHRDTKLLAEGYKEELARLNSLRQDEFSHNSSLEQQLDQASTRIAILEMELDKANLKANAMLEFGQEKERLITPSRQEISALKNLLHNKQRELDEALAHIDSLKKKQDSLQLLLKEKEVSLAAKDSEFSVIDSAKNGLSAELNDLQNRLSLALDTTTKVNGLLKEALQGKEAAEAQVLTLNGRVRELEQKLTGQKPGQDTGNERAVAQPSGESQTQLKALNQVIAGHEATIAELNKKLEAALQQSESATSQPAGVNLELTKLRTQLADTLREKDTLKAKLGELTTQLEASRPETAGPQPNNGPDNSALEKKIAELQAALDAKNARVGELEQQVSALETERQKAALAQEQIVTLRESVREKAAQLDEASRLSKELADKLTQSERQQASFSGKINVLGELLAEVQADKKLSTQRAMEGEKEIAELKDGLSSLEHEKEALIAELESRQAKIEALLATMDSRKMTGEKVSEQNLLIKNATDKQVEALQTLLHAKEKAIQRLTALTGSLMNSKNDLNSMTLEMEHLKSLLRAKDLGFQKLAAGLGAMAAPKIPTPLSNTELSELRALLAAKSSAFHKLAVTTADLAGREREAGLELKRVKAQYEKLLLELTDSDHDSVPDSRDNCSETPAGAAVDDKGCSADSDSDGVLNGLDLCPESSKKSVNVLGCGDGEAILLSQVTFTPGSSELSAPVREQLLPLIPILGRYPDIFFEVAGHTDNVGDHEKNMLISEERAVSVRDFFIEHGLNKSRFTAKGYGPDHPVGDNNTYQGRKDNRRVELHTKQIDLQPLQ